MNAARRHSIPTWLASIVLLVPVLGACDGTSVFGVRGSGDVISESREVSGFDPDRRKKLFEAQATSPRKKGIQQVAKGMFKSNRVTVSEANALVES